MIWFPAPHFLASPLIKVPLLLVAARLVALTTTGSPTPPSSIEERKAYVGARDPAKPLAELPRIFWNTTRGIYYANAICESAVILAELYPSALSDAVLSYLIRDTLRTSHNVRITPYWLAGCFAMIAGSVLRLWCFRTLGRLFTWELAVKKDHALVTSGPYAVVRHPSYTGNILIGAGILLCYFGPGSWYTECVGWETWGSRAFTALWSAWVLAIPTTLSARTPTEDEILHKKFGDEWEMYAKRTPYRLIPFVY
ncbi:isoprenylcysteine carboxylmethyltransferase family protein [Phanerochaete sordida]|uniref:Protein-S-isoprenylcysteine O-methyltransferase n=1 Tax=Phanerochaete sordida TaxID=48140 RepID=A0A9P3LH14_9APHY|nr:isoprenylcysteine carboxylmethyltransferase family protein [Phanerochaete sordida]